MTHKGYVQSILERAIQFADSPSLAIKNPSGVRFIEDPSDLTQKEYSALSVAWTLSWELSLALRDPASIGAHDMATAMWAVGIWMDRLVNDSPAMGVGTVVDLSQNREVLKKFAAHVPTRARVQCLPARAQRVAKMLLMAIKWDIIADFAEFLSAYDRYRAESVLTALVQANKEMVEHEIPYYPNDFFRKNWWGVNSPHAVTGAVTDIRRVALSVDTSDTRLLFTTRDVISFGCARASLEWWHVSAPIREFSYSSWSYTVHIYDDPAKAISMVTDWWTSLVDALNSAFRDEMSETRDYWKEKTTHD